MRAVVAFFSPELGDRRNIRRCSEQLRLLVSLAVRGLLSSGLLIPFTFFQSSPFLFLGALPLPFTCLLLLLLISQPQKKADRKFCGIAMMIDHPSSPSLSFRYIRSLTLCRLVRVFTFTRCCQARHPCFLNCVLFGW